MVNRPASNGEKQEYSIFSHFQASNTTSLVELRERNSRTVGFLAAASSISADVDERAGLVGDGTGVSFYEGTL